MWGSVCVCTTSKNRSPQHTCLSQKIKPCVHTWHAPSLITLTTLTRQRTWELLVRQPSPPPGSCLGDPRKRCKRPLNGGAGHSAGVLAAARLTQELRGLPCAAGPRVHGCHHSFGVQLPAGAAHSSRRRVRHSTHQQAQGAGAGAINLLKQAHTLGSRWALPPCARPPSPLGTWTHAAWSRPPTL